MRVLFDTNVILDVLLRRQLFYVHAAEIVSRVESGKVNGYLSATTVTTIHYFVAKKLGAEKALDALRKLLALFEIAPVGRPVLESALTLGSPDFEDAVLLEAARQVGADAVVSRDPGGFPRTELPVCSPDELLHALALRGGEVHERRA